MSKTKHVANAPQFPLPFSHAVTAGDFVYVSGQVGVDPSTLKIVGETIEEQTTQSMRNIEIILNDVGLTLDHVIKVNAFITNPADIPKYNETYAKLFNEPYPARTTAPSDLGAYLIEVEAIAYAPARREQTK